MPSYDTVHADVVNLVVSIRPLNLGAAVDPSADVGAKTIWIKSPAGTTSSAAAAFVTIGTDVYYQATFAALPTKETGFWRARVVSADRGSSVVGKTRFLVVADKADGGKDW